ncbi:MerR family DNA-binding transcriptional regulator [Fodinicola feengrottensis]
MKIGELARRTGVSVRALRYYQEQGLLAPTRDANGYRCFAASDVSRVATIQLLFSTGMRSSCVIEALPCMTGATDDAAPALVKNLLVVRERLVSDIQHRTRSLAVLERVLASAIPDSGPAPVFEGGYDDCIVRTTTPRTALPSK